jgi:hypothetical protein
MGGELIYLTTLIKEIVLIFHKFNVRTCMHIHTSTTVFLKLFDEPFLS